MVNNVPSRIKIERDKSPLFEEIKAYFPKNTYNSDIFALAFAYGYKSGKKSPIQFKKDFINVNSISDELKSMIFLIGLEEHPEDIEGVVANPAEAYETAQEYANEGIVLLYEEFTNSKENFDLLLCADFADSSKVGELKRLNGM